MAVVCDGDRPGLCHIKFLRRLFAVMRGKYSEPKCLESMPCFKLMCLHVVVLKQTGMLSCIA